MGNKFYKQKTEQKMEADAEAKSLTVPCNVKEEDTLSIISDPEPLLTPAQNIVSTSINVASDIAESLSKSAPIDIPIHDTVVDKKSEIVEENNTFEENNNTEEIASLSSISEECGFKSEPITEESDLDSDEDVLELDE